MTEPSLGGLSVVTTAPATGVPGWMLRDTMKVRVVNTTGRPRSGAIVTWAVTAGGGSISPVRDTTDADGLALAVWTLGPQAGLNEVTARASDKYAATLSTVAEAVRVDHVAGSVDMGMRAWWLGSLVAGARILGRAPRPFPCVPVPRSAGCHRMRPAMWTGPPDSPKSRSPATTQSALSTEAGAPGAHLSPNRPWRNGQTSPPSSSAWRGMGLG
jgi:hypothetical protein